MFKPDVHQTKGTSGWVGAVIILLAGWGPGTYLALILSWALLPIALQLAFGADILWQCLRLVGLAIVPLALYHSLAMR